MIEPGHVFTVGFSHRGTPITMADAGGPILNVYRNVSGDPATSDGILSLRLDLGATSSSGGVYTVIDWYARLKISPNLSVQVGEVLNPFADPMIGKALLYFQTNGREFMGYHQWAVAAQMSSFDTAASTFASDGVVSVQLDGTTIMAATGLSLAHRLTTHTVRLAFKAEVDADAVWVGGGLSFPTSYDVGGRPTLPSLITFWSWDAGDTTGWDNWLTGPQNNTPIVHTTAGMNRTGGISRWGADPTTGSLSGTVKAGHVGLWQTEAGASMVPNSIAVRRAMFRKVGSRTVDNL